MRPLAAAEMKKWGLCSRRKNIAGVPSSLVPISPSPLFLLPFPLPVYACYAGETFPTLQTTQTLLTNKFLLFEYTPNWRNVVWKAYTMNNKTQWFSGKWENLLLSLGTVEVILTQYTEIYFKTFLEIKILKLSNKLVSTVFPEFHHVAWFMLCSRQRFINQVYSKQYHWLVQEL